VRLRFNGQAVRKFYNTIGLANRQREIPENIGTEAISKITIVNRIITKIIDFFQNQNFQSKKIQCWVLIPSYLSLIE
jgi:hypothetical protein